MVLSVFLVGHSEVGMKRDVVLLDALPGKNEKRQAFKRVLVLFLPRHDGNRASAHRSNTALFAKLSNFISAGLYHCTANMKKRRQRPEKIR